MRKPGRYLFRLWHIAVRSTRQTFRPQEFADEFVIRQKMLPVSEILFNLLLQLLPGETVILVSGYQLPQQQGEIRGFGSAEERPDLRWPSLPPRCFKCIDCSGNGIIINLY